MFFWALSENYGNIRSKVDVYAAMAPCLRMDKGVGFVKFVRDTIESQLQVMLLIHSWALCQENLMDSIFAVSSGMRAQVESLFGLRSSYMDNTSYDR